MVDRTERDVVVLFGVPLRQSLLVETELLGSKEFETNVRHFRWSVGIGHGIRHVNQSWVLTRHLAELCASCQFRRRRTSTTLSGGFVVMRCYIDYVVYVQGCM